MMIAHAAVMELMHVFGYNQNGKGICNGFTWMWIQSKLLGPVGELQFYNRLCLIAENDKDFHKLKIQVDLLKSLIVTHNGNPTHQKAIYTANLKLFEILSFCEGLELYHNPELHGDLFFSEIANEQFNPAQQRVTQDDLSRIAPLTAPDALHNKIMTPLMKSCFIFTHQECAAYFQDLQSWFEKNKKIFGDQTCVPIKIGTDNHAVGCSYEFKSKKWQFIDINDDEVDCVRRLLSADELTTNLQLSFGSEGMLLLNVIPVILSSARLTDETLAELEELNSRHQNITKKRAESKNIRQASLAFLATKMGDLKTMAKLVAVGANFNETKDNGSTLLSLACQYKEYEVVELLVSSGVAVNQAKKNGDTPLFLAAQTGDLQIVKLLLNNNANMNQMNANGMNPLLLAIQNKNLALAELLLAKGADPNVCKLNGVCALELAIKSNHFNMIQLLVNKGAKIDRLLSNGLTPINDAIVNENQSLVGFFFEKNANINLKDQDGHTTLWWASVFGNESVVDKILRISAQTLNLACESGHTPLLVACLSHYTTLNLRLFEILLDHGADIGSRNDAGHTALEIALHEGDGNKNHAAIVAILRYCKQNHIKYNELLSNEMKNNKVTMDYLNEVYFEMDKFSVKHRWGLFGAELVKLAIQKDNFKPSQSSILA